MEFLEAVFLTHVRHCTLAKIYYKIMALFYLPHFLTALNQAAALANFCDRFQKGGCAAVQDGDRKK